MNAVNTRFLRFREDFGWYTVIVMVKQLQHAIRKVPFEGCAQGVEGGGGRTLDLPRIRRFLELSSAQNRQMSCPDESGGARKW